MVDAVISFVWDTARSFEPTTTAKASSEACRSALLAANGLIAGVEGIEIREPTTGLAEDADDFPDEANQTA
jgi:hypothetical protein